VRKLSIFICTLLLLNFTGCEDKKTKDSTPIENTTEIYGAPTGSTQNTSRFKVQKKEKAPSEAIDTRIFSDTFVLNDIKGTHYTVTVSNQKVTFKESDKAIVLVTFFATWCPPCVHEMPYFNDLHKKYTKDLLITGVLVHDTIADTAFKSFLAKNEVRYSILKSTQNNDFASLVAKTLHLPHNFSIPLTVMYVSGEYFTHYEGCVPVEMIEYDIQEALKTLK